jgi:hypothetical protein
MSHHDLLFDAGEEIFRGAYETKSITNKITMSPNPQPIRNNFTLRVPKSE